MVNFYPGFILPEAARLYEAERALRRRYPQDEDFRAAVRELRRQNPLPKASVHQVVDHIEHVIQTAGIDHVGLGSDFDGIPAVPEQLEDVSKYPVITQELLNRGYTKEQVVKVLGGNLLRAFRRAEEVAGRK
jgi:membrane dipeptidase